MQNFVKFINSRNFLPLAIAVSIIFFASCQEKDNNQRTIPELIAHFKKSGLKIDKIEPVIFQIIKAQDGCVIYIDKVKVEIYKYDKRLKQQREKIEKIEENGNIFILGLDFPVRVNGSFILLNYNNHPKRYEIIQAFESFE